MEQCWDEHRARWSWGSPPSCWGHSQVPALPFRSSVWQRSCCTRGCTRLQSPAPLQALRDTAAHSSALPEEQTSICRAEDGGRSSSAFMGRSNAAQIPPRPQSKGLWAELRDGLLVHFPAIAAGVSPALLGSKRRRGESPAQLL